MPTLTPEQIAQQYGGTYNPSFRVGGPDPSDTNYSSNVYLKFPSQYGAIKNNYSSNLYTPEGPNWGGVPSSSNGTSYMTINDWNTLFPGIDPLSLDSGYYSMGENQSMNPVVNASAAYPIESGGWLDDFFRSILPHSPLQALQFIGGLVAPAFAPGIGSTLGGALGNAGSALSGFGSNLASTLSKVSPALGGFAQSVGTPLAQFGQGLGNMLGVGGQGAGQGTGQGVSNGAFTGGSGSGSAMAQFGTPQAGTYGVPYNSIEIPGNVSGGSFYMPVNEALGSGANATGAMNTTFGSGLNINSAINSALGAGALGSTMGGFATGPTSSVSSDFGQYGQGGGSGGNQNNFDQSNRDSYSLATLPWSTSGINQYGDMINQQSPLGYIGKNEQKQENGGNYQGFLDPSLLGSSFQGGM